MGGDVALKAVAPGLVHKTEAGAVALKLSGFDAVHEAAEQMAARVHERTGANPSAYLVQRMLSGAVEMLVGMVHDRQFGPTIACGAGGTLVELLKDVSVRLAPLIAGDAHQMVRDLRMFPVLQGYRGAPPC